MIEELEEEVIEEVEEEISEEEAEQPTPLELEASEMGWTDKETFVANGGDVEKWVSPHEYVRYGKLQESTRKQIDAVTRKSNEQIENLKKYQRAQMEAKDAELEEAQRVAIQNADQDQFDRLQKQRDALDTPDDTPTAIEKDSAIVAWEEKNPWVNDANSPKTIKANALFSAAINNQRLSIPDALSQVDKELAALYPNDNPLRRQETMTENGKKPTKRKNGKGLSWEDLKPDEIQEWKLFGEEMFSGDKKKFLQTVETARTEA